MLILFIADTPSHQSEFSTFFDYIIRLYYGTCHWGCVVFLETHFTLCETIGIYKIPRTSFVLFGWEKCLGMWLNKVSIHHTHTHTWGGAGSWRVVKRTSPERPVVSPVADMGSLRGGAGGGDLLAPSWLGAALSTLAFWGFSLGLLCTHSKLVWTGLSATGSAGEVASVLKQ